MKMCLKGERVFYGVPFRTKMRTIIFHPKSNVFAVEVEYFEVEYIKIEVENLKFEVEYIKIKVERKCEN